ncbi:MAG: pyridoxamine 5'-phosphate oxidase family protein [Vicinamibacterales bacterium]
MGKLYSEIGPDHRSMIEAQPLFFVATAPLSGGGRVNLSPKGLDSLRVLDARRVMYLDLTGSGNETAAHVTENERLTLMFCAFEGSPKILRLYCRGRIVTRLSPEWPALLAHFPPQPGVRQIVVGDVQSVQTSCGFGVPLLSLREPRTQLPRWAEAKGESGLVEYRRTRNATSIDGLPAPETDRRD